jgi:hypothetical protein
MQDPHKTNSRHSAAVATLVALMSVALIMSTALVVAHLVTPGAAAASASGGGQVQVSLTTADVAANGGQPPPRMLDLEATEFFFSASDPAEGWKFIDYLSALQPPINERTPAAQQQTFLEFARGRGASDALTTGSLKLSLASREMWPRSQMHAQSAAARWAAAGLEGRPPCTTWVDIDGQPAKTVGAAASRLHECAGATRGSGTAAATSSPALRVPLAPGEIAYLSESSTVAAKVTSRPPPVAILWGRPGTAEFAAFDALLRAEAEAGRCVYILRPVAGCAADSSAPASVELGGFGVELTLKKTEYKTGDSTPPAAAARDAGAEMAAARGAEAAAAVVELDPLEDTRELGLRAATAVLASADPLATLAELAGSFPVAGGRQGERDRGFRGFT